MSDTNRIGEACWYVLKMWCKESRAHVGQWRRAYLRAWSTDYEEFDNGAATFAAAVVEDYETTRVVVVRADAISFSPEQPGGV